MIDHRLDKQNAFSFIDVLGPPLHSWTAYNCIFCKDDAGEKISILRIAPSPDVAFPRAGIFVQQSLPESIVSNIYTQDAWAVPDSIEFEWKEWPSAFPRESTNDGDLKKIRDYGDQVCDKVQRKHATIGVRNIIPNDVIAALLQSMQAAESDRSSEPSLKLFLFSCRMD